MTEPAQQQEDDVLRRMLSTPLKPHKDEKGGKPKPAPSNVTPRDERR